MDGVLYCKTHFEQLFKETGSFSKKFTPGKNTMSHLVHIFKNFKYPYNLRIKGIPQRFVA
jgi:hypothetical protein